MYNYYQPILVTLKCNFSLYYGILFDNTGGISAER